MVSVCMGLSPIRLFCRKYALLLFNSNIHIFIKKVKEKHLGYHIQTGNRDNFLSLDFGLLEFGILDVEERLKRYRRYVYEAGALGHPGKEQARVIDKDLVDHERKKNYEIKRIDRFRYRTRYSMDSGTIGTVLKNLFPATTSDLRTCSC